MIGKPLTATDELETTGDQPRRSRPEAKTASGRRLRWWREVTYVAVFYGVYSWIRNQFGSAGPGASKLAYGHALDIIDIQRSVHLFFEPSLQKWYLGLPADGLIRLWNIYYGTAHFIVTALALILLYRRQPDRYALWRNALAIMTALALIGFSAYSLMPPRLLDDTSQYGACHGRTENCNGFGLIDTLEVHGGWLSFQDEEVAQVSNQYAAMPSMHTGWSTWSFGVLWGLIGSRKWRWISGLYPIATVFCIMVTANHYWLDAVGGLVAFGAALGLAKLFTAWTDRRFEARGL